MSLAAPIPPVSPAQAASVTPDALARLLAGGVVDARVVAASAQGGLLKLMLANGTLDMQADDVKLPPGTRVAIQQLGTDAQGRVFQIVPLAQNTTADDSAFSPKLTPFIARFLASAGGEAAAKSQMAGQVAQTPQQTAAAANAVAPPTLSPLAQARDLLMPLVRNALARQGGFAPLFANLEAASQLPLEKIPYPVRVMLENTLMQRLDPAAQDDLAQALKAAVSQSGIFQEAHLVNGAPAAANADMKTQLLSLRQVLTNWLMQEGGPPPQAPVQDSQRLRPPLRGEMMQAQKPEQAAIEPNMKPAEIAAHLLAETDSVLDRIRLMQFAGISDRIAALPSQVEPQQRQWLTEVPLQMPNGVAVLPLAIERDGGSGAAGYTPDQRVWRMRFTLETNELGPLDVTIALRGQHVDVKFWAERPATAAMIDAESNVLAETLSEAELTVDSVSCQAGRRPQAQHAPARKSGQFVDCKS